jgi:hypothetical protein
MPHSSWRPYRTPGQARPRLFRVALFAALLALPFLIGVGAILRSLPLRALSQSGPVRLEEPRSALPPNPLPPLVPGLLHLADALATPSGWWVLDRRQTSILFLDHDLAPQRQVGRRGSGPGEFQTPVALGLTGDTLLVLESEGTPILHRFSVEGAFLDRSPLEVEGCHAFLASQLHLEGDTVPVVAGTCLRLLPVPSVGAMLVRVRAGGETEPLAESFRTLRPGSLHPEAMLVSPFRGALWTGLSSSPCLEPLGALDGAPAPLCLDPWVGIRFSTQELLARMGPAARSGRGALLRQLVGEMPWLPVMDRIFPHPEGFLLRRLSDLEARNLILLHADGRQEALWTDLPESTFVSGGKVLIGWEGPEGIHLEVRSVPGHLPPVPAGPGARPLQ